jgi:hypothetical protein
MPTLRINGTTDKQLNQRANAQRFGYELILLIEASQVTSRLDQKVIKMREWLEKNPDHPKRQDRDNRYWSVVSDRNEAQARLNDHVANLVRIHRDLTKDAIQRMSEAYGAEVTPSMARQIEKVAKENGEDGLWKITDKWAMEQTERQERITA